MESGMTMTTTKQFIEPQGKHLIIDMHDAEQLNNIPLAEKAFTEAAEAAGATILGVHLHEFATKGMPEAGFSGVAVLAESHMSVHTWPESRYAAFDIFMCGDTDVNAAMDVLVKYFKPKRVDTYLLSRTAKNN
jgi:S-adenosylmethionine decarboxylase